MSEKWRKEKDIESRKYIREEKKRKELNQVLS
jgi:hypothetical protein